MAGPYIVEDSPYVRDGAPFAAEGSGNNVAPPEPPPTDPGPPRPPEVASQYVSGAPVTNIDAIALLFDQSERCFDLHIDPSGDFKRANWLQTAIVTSLFTDSRVDDEGGCWSDLLAGYSHGSGLWTHQRRSITDELARLYRDEAERALAWLINENHVRAIQVKAERDRNRITLCINVTGNLGLTDEFIYVV